MKNKGSKRRRMSAGTVFMLVMLAVVLCGSALVLGRLSSGASVDLSKLHMTVLDIRNENRTGAEDAEEQPVNEEMHPAAQRIKTTAAARTTEAPPADEESFTLTLAGSINLSGEVRKNSKSTDAKIADYADVMMLLSPEINSSMNGVFLENILSDRHKASDTVAPGEAALLLKEAGFEYAACGFSQAYSSGKDGISATLDTLNSQGIRTLGIYGADGSGMPEVRTVNSVRTAIMQYTATVSDKTRNSMSREGTSGMLPEAELSRISEDIDTAREEGAEAVIILINWGKTGKEPDRKQTELAQGIAEAGADLIVGNGSHVPQGAEYLTGQNGKQVLCIWSLGSLLSGDRSSIKRLSSYLLHVTIRRDGEGGAEIQNPRFTPVYTWKYKQDGRFYYRCVAANGTVPDGMDSEQKKNMNKAAETVRDVLKGSPLTERGRADAE